MIFTSKKCKISWVSNAHFFFKYFPKVLLGLEVLEVLAKSNHIHQRISFF